MEQKIRNLPAKTIVTLDELAKQNGQSRESYIRDLLNRHVLSAEVEGLNMKYETLVQTMSQEWITALNANTKALHKFLEIHGVKIDD
ncbi:FitA-like ribbon-helix-helix domain-containing protein [Enterococcus faecalis]|uniref:FitA-like ribbon-helix-helix domain-containing protein n=1 Tax=Enterococcus faecalis TaxID=1351 RepID=UPI0013E920B1|nr:ribbon-helix-helix protein, CopG family [Enterococcus faecalis]